MESSQIISLNKCKDKDRKLKETNLFAQQVIYFVFLSICLSNNVETFSDSDTFLIIEPSNIAKDNVLH